MGIIKIRENTQLEARDRDCQELHIIAFVAKAKSLSSDALERVRIGCEEACEKIIAREMSQE